MKFFDTLERLGLGRPVTDIYASIYERVIKKIELGQKVTEVRLHPEWYAELMRSLATHSRYSSFLPTFTKGGGVLTIRIDNAEFIVTTDTEVSFIDIVVDPDSIRHWDWVESGKGY